MVRDILMTVTVGIAMVAVGCGGGSGTSKADPGTGGKVGGDAGGSTTTGTGGSAVMGTGGASVVATGGSGAGAVVSGTPLTGTTLAGTSSMAGVMDGAGTAALFSSPTGIATDGVGNLYVADTNNQIIRKIVVASGEVTTLAGAPGMIGNTDGVGALAVL